MPPCKATVGSTDGHAFAHAERKGRHPPSSFRQLVESVVMVAGCPPDWAERMAKELNPPAAWCCPPRRQQRQREGGRERESGPIWRGRNGAGEVTGLSARDE